MKRALLLALTMTLLLAGCGAQRRDERLAQERLGRISAAETVTFSASVTARTGEEEFSYTAEARRQEGGFTVTLGQPEALSGVRLRSADGGETLEYDGAALFLGGTLTEGRLSPAGALPLLDRALREGRLLRTRRSEGCLACELELDEDLSVTVWLLPPALDPQRAELTLGGYTAAAIEISDWKETE